MNEKLSEELDRFAKQKTEELKEVLAKAPDTKLTIDNYYHEARPHISNSQISDYLKDPEFFYRRHVLLELPFKVTDPMKRGLVVDAILTGVPDEEGRVIIPYQKKVLKRDDPEKYEEQKEMDDRYLVPERIWDEAMELTEYVYRQPFWQAGLSKAQFQVVLESQMEGLPICGLPDRVDYKKGEWWITDLKCVSPMKISSPAKWLWNALDMGYIRQAALYQYLWAKKKRMSVTDMKRKIRFFHAAAAHFEPGLNKVELYEVPQSLMDEQLEVIRDVLRKIKRNQFDSPKVKWNKAITLANQGYGIPEVLTQEEYGDL